MHVNERPGQVDRHIGSTEKIERLTGWRARTPSTKGSSAPSPGIARTRPGGGSAPARRPRLLVLGAGPAQLGLLDAARKRGLHVIAADRDPQARRVRARGRARDHLDRRRARRSSGSRGRARSTGSSRRESTGRSGSPPGSPSGSGFRIRSTPRRRGSRRRSRASGSASRRPACRSRAGARRSGGAALLPLRRQAARPAGTARALRRARAGRARGGGRGRARESRGGAVLVEELVEGPEVTVNAFSVDGAFLPLAVTDRLRAEPPAYGVALAHAWPVASTTGRGRRRARRGGRRSASRNGPTYTQIRLGAEGRA